MFFLFRYFLNEMFRGQSLQFLLISRASEIITEVGFNEPCRLKHKKNENYVVMLRIWLKFSFAIAYVDLK